MRTSALAIASAALLIALVSDSAAWSQEQVEQAKTLFNAGAQAYETGQFQAASQAFEQAYKLSPRPGILFSLAQAYRRQYYIDKKPENLRQAITTYRDYLSKVQQGGRRADAAQSLAELEPIAARLAADSSSSPPPVPVKPKTRVMIASQTLGAKAILDQGSAVPVPLISEVAPGTHRVRVVAPGYYDENRNIAAAEGAVVALDLALREKPARLLFQGEPGAEITIDGRLVGTTPLAVPLEIPAGHHLIALTKNGRKALVQEMVLDRDEAKTLAYQLPNTGQRVVSYGILVGAGAAVVTGAAFTGLALRSQNQAQDVLDSQASGNILASDARAYDDARADRDRWRTAAAISFGSGLALGVTGLLLWAFDRPSVAAPAPRYEPRTPEPTRPREPSSIDMSAIPFWIPGAAGMGVTGRF